MMLIWGLLFKTKLLILSFDSDVDKSEWDQLYQFQDSTM